MEMDSGQDEEQIQS